LAEPLDKQPEFLAGQGGAMVFGVTTLDSLL
jgi:hypothetical protein